MQGMQRVRVALASYLTAINQSKTMHRQIVVNQQYATLSRKLNKPNKLNKLNYGLIVHSRHDK